MVKNRKFEGTRPDRSEHTNLPVMPFRAPAPSSLEIEVLRMSELRGRISREMLARPHLYEFHLIILVTQEHCTQIVDFAPVPCTSGTVLCVRAGQAHLFGQESNWDGWLVLFRPEFQPSSLTACPTILRLSRLENLPTHLVSPPDGFSVLTEMARQMQRDMQQSLPQELSAVLLRHQLSTFLVRLVALTETQTVAEMTATRTTSRFEKFQEHLEAHYARWHRVSDYAQAMHCSERSLTRATQEVSGATPKAMITARQILEARRMLVHGRASVAEIGYRLGFKEPTNFVKFFRRETGTTPAEFRRRQQSVTGNRA